MEDTRTHLGRQLKAARQDAGMKQEQVARVLSISASAVSAMEAGQRRVDALELSLMGKLYGKPLAWFFGNAPVNESTGIRWYDSDPLLREVIHLLHQAAPDLRRKAAYGLLGFLGK